MRMAISTANAMSMQTAKPMSEMEFSELVQKLRCYLPVNEPEVKTVGPAEAARISRAK